MKVSKLLCLFPLLLILLSCSPATEPEGGDPPDEEFELVGQAEIGPAGGTLSGEGIELTFATGALDDSYDLELRRKATGTTPFDGLDATPYFSIEGLPETGFVPFHASLEFEGEPGDNPMVALSLYDYEYESEEWVQGFDLVEAQASGGRLEADLIWEAAGETRRSLPEGLRPFLQGIFGGVEVERVGNFKYYYELEFAEDVALLSLLLDTEIAILLDDWNLNFQSNLFDWPLKIYVLKPWDSDGDGEFEYTAPFYRVRGGWSPLIPLKVLFFVPSTHISPELDDGLAGTLGEFLLRFYQANCEGFDTNGWQHEADEMLHTAFYNWGEEVFNTDPEWRRPWGLTGEEADLLEGIYPESIGWLDGCQRAPLVKSIMDDEAFGIEGYRHTWEAVRSGSRVMDALLTYHDRHIWDWLPDFYIDYFQGEIYGVDYLQLIQDPCATWTPGEDNEEFLLNDGLGEDFRDLSAKVLIIDLEDEYEENARLSFSITSDEVNDASLSLILFKGGNRGLSYLGHGNDWTLSGLQTDLVGQGVDRLIAVALNASHDQTYLGTSEVYVEMSLDQSPSYNAVGVSAQLDVWRWNPYYSQSFLSGDEEFIWNEAHGTVTAPSFSVPIQYTFGSGPDRTEIEGHVDGVISEDFTVLHEVTAVKTMTYYNGGMVTGSYRDSMVVTGPIEVLENNPGSFWVYGETVCNHITWMEANEYGFYDTWLTGHECRASSDLYIGFYNVDP